MNKNDQVILAVTGQVCDQGFTRLGRLAPAVTESSFFKDLPAVGGDKLVRRLEGDDINVALDGLEKDKIFAPILVEISGNDIIEVSVLDRSFVSVQF